MEYQFTSHLLKPPKIKEIAFGTNNEYFPMYNKNYNYEKSSNYRNSWITSELWWF